MAKITRTNPKTISKPFASYSHVVTAEGAKKLVFCAGQVAADVDGKVLPPDDFGAQTKMVMKNLKNALAAGGAKLSDVTKVTIYICNPHDVPKDRVETLRRAFDATMKDPEFLAEAEKTKLTVGPLPGEELQKLVADVAAISPAILEKVRAAYAPSK